MEGPEQVLSCHALPRVWFCQLKMERGHSEITVFLRLVLLFLGLGGSPYS